MESIRIKKNYFDNQLDRSITAGSIIEVSSERAKELVANPYDIAEYVNPPKEGADIVLEPKQELNPPLKSEEGIRREVPFKPAVTPKSEPTVEGKSEKGIDSGNETNVATKSKPKARQRKRPARRYKGTKI